MTTAPEKFTARQLLALKAAFEPLRGRKLDPTSHVWRSLGETVDKMTKAQLEQVKAADMPFVSRKASTRLLFWGRKPGQ
jgi:hypothetical protein